MFLTAQRAFARRIVGITLLVLIPLVFLILAVFIPLGAAGEGPRTTAPEARSAAADPRIVPLLHPTLSDLAAHGSG